MKNKLYNILFELSPRFTPLSILIVLAISHLNYRKEEDPGGWGGLAFAAFMIASLAWLLIVTFINYLINHSSKNNFKKAIIKTIISILNLFIYINKFLNEIDSELLLIINFGVIIIFIILIFTNKIGGYYEKTDA